MYTAQLISYILYTVGWGNGHTSIEKPNCIILWLTILACQTLLTGRRTMSQCGQTVLHIHTRTCTGNTHLHTHNMYTYTHTHTLTHAGNMHMHTHTHTLTHGKTEPVHNYNKKNNPKKKKTTTFGYERVFGNKILHTWLHVHLVPDQIDTVPRHLTRPNTKLLTLYWNPSLYTYELAML